MTEQEFLASDDPAAVLDFCRSTAVPRGPHGQSSTSYRERWPVSPRRLRLFACACARRVWPLLTDERSRQAVEVAERYADGKASYHALVTAVLDADACWRTMSQRRTDQEQSRRAALAASWVSPIDTATGNSVDIVDAIGHVLQYTGDGIGRAPTAWQAALLREIVGNPYRPVTLPTVRVDVPAWEDGPAGYRDECPWLTPTVLALARVAYDERGRKCEPCGGTGEWEWSPRIDRAYKACRNCRGTGRTDDGTLGPQRLLILADALEEAGCTDETVLRHLRGYQTCWQCGGTGSWAGKFHQPGVPRNCLRCGGERQLRLRGPHVRGCWCLDLLLGKE